jgi:hypothetical protein
MAVFIRKERLGSGSPPDRVRVIRGQSFSSLPSFQKLQQEYAEAAAEKAAERKEKWESNAEVQRRRRMTQEERSRGAIEKVAKNLKEYADQKAGRDTSYDEARKKAEKIAYKQDRQKKGE